MTTTRVHRYYRVGALSATSLTAPAIAARFIKAAALCVTLFGATGAAAQKAQALYQFGPPPDAGTPNGGLVMDPQGRLLGVTRVGGANNLGAVYRLTLQPDKTWTEEVLHSFTGADGSTPSAALVLDSAGNIYGVTTVGGAYNDGTVFAISDSSGSFVLTTLHSFGNGTDGAVPVGGLVFGSDGMLYGTTQHGGSGCCGYGTVFRLSPQGDEVGYEVIHNFAGGADGFNPGTNLVITSKNVIIGTAIFGGGYSDGTVFRIAQPAPGQWTESVVYNFQGGPNDVTAPATAQEFIAGPKDTIYGCGFDGQFNHGGIFRLQSDPSAPSGWSESLIYSSPGNTGDPAIWACSLSVGKGGTLWGTSPETFGGEGASEGDIISLTPPATSGGAWTEANVWIFGKGRAGYNPVGGLVPKGGFFYGLNQVGPKKSPGVVFKFVP
jgi:uncharacterized repeat protein (TIGR03803 family)